MSSSDSSSHINTQEMIGADCNQAEQAAIQSDQCQSLIKVGSMTPMGLPAGCQDDQEMITPKKNKLNDILELLSEESLEPKQASQDIMNAPRKQPAD